jgi:hypothetical protein
MIATPLDGSEELRKENVKSLKRKANMQASIHATLADRYALRYVLLRYGTLLFSSLLLALTFVSEDFVTRTLPLSVDGFRWLRAGVSVLNFYAGLVLLYSKPAEKEAQHRKAVNHYSQTVYDLRSLEERGELSDESALQEIRTRYLDVSGLPHISERLFLRMKRRHYVKVNLSQYLERHPHAWIWWVRMKLWWDDMKGDRNPVQTKNH